MKTLLVRHVSKIKIACDDALNQVYAFVYKINSQSVPFHPSIECLFSDNKISVNISFQGPLERPKQDAQSVPLMVERLTTLY